LYGLPIGETMEGKPLVQAFDEEVVLDTIPDWEKVEGDFGTHPTDLQEDPWAAQEAMQQLIELGYIDAPGENIAQRIEEVKNESKYYVARNLLDAGKNDKAIEILEPIFEETKETRYGQKLAHAYLSTKKFKKCRALIEKLKEKQIEVKVEEEKLSEKELAKKKRGFSREIELPNYIDYVEGLLLMYLNRPEKALKLLRKVEENAPNSLSVVLNIGKVCLMRQRWADAQDAFIKVLAIDESNSFAHHGLGVTFLRENKLEEALGEFLTAIEFDYFYPKAHYHIGETLAKLEKYEEATQAFELAISMAPGMTKAHKWLIEIYKNQLNQLEKVAEHERFIKEKIKGEIVIVSGLPRSGTSMMMQILDKGGYDVLTDKVREADNNNPKGYYEFEPVKKLMMDKSWLPEAEGKVVKIIAQLLPFLPSNYDYKIIFMRRDMSEVLKSQQIMLGKEKDVKSKAFPMGLNDAFQKQLIKVENWIDSQPNVEMLSVDYSNVIENAEAEIDNVISFLSSPGDRDKMMKVVDKKLYRNKS
jgi:tetratricopeptide (TPR) repeat protein